MDTTKHTTNIRIRLTDSQLADLEVIRAFLGLPSVSQAAARLATWNAGVLATSLRSDSDTDVGPFALLVAKAANGATKEAIRELLSRG